MRMKNKFEKIFEQLADFHTLAGYDGWMIGACVYEQWEAEGEHISGTGFDYKNGLTEAEKQKMRIQNPCGPGLVKKTSSFAVMRNQLELDGSLYQLELHVVKPEVRETEQYGQDDVEENTNIGKTKAQRIAPCRQNKIEEDMDTDVGRPTSFTQPDILRFVDAVGDTNSIHRTAHAVVPGLLMVEWMLGNLQETGNLTESPGAKKLKCRFRFEKPVFVDEKLQVDARTERGKQIYECRREDKEIVWNMRIL